LHRWSHDSAQKRWPVVLRWGDCFGREEERLESGWVRWIMGEFSSCLLSFSDRKRGGGEAAPQCWRRTIQRRAVRRANVMTGVCRSKMTKGNWVGGLNAWLGQTAYWVGEKNIAESMRWTIKIGEGILAG
jgi:hypothetical protein